MSQTKKLQNNLIPIFTNQMKIFIFILTLLFALLTCCQMPIPKIENTPLHSDEWLIFKQATEITIRNNEVHIADLKEENIYLGKELNIDYQKKINKFAQQNKEIREKIEAYQMENTRFSTFKHQIETDMNLLGKNLNELTLNNQQK